MSNQPVDDFRARQAELKAQYREDPESALTPLSARGSLSATNPGFAVEQFTGTTEAGLHRATGGDGTAACSGDMLLEAVLACAGVTLRAVATAMGIVLEEVTGEATAVLDARGTLGVSRSAPVGIQDLVVTFSVQSPAGDEELQKLVPAVERFCVVGASLADPPRFEIRRAS